MADEKIINDCAEEVSGGSVVSAAENMDFDRCPLCDNPTPVVNGYCTCTNCGHRWAAGSH